MPPIQEALDEHLGINDERVYVEREFCTRGIQVERKSNFDQFFIQRSILSQFQHNTEI